MNTSTAENRQRLDRLEQHLAQENPTLLEVVREFRSLDRVAQRLGLLKADDTFATQVSWWPLVSVLGTFSAGKSSFINHYLGQSLQRSGNQAVDDKFTVICHSPGGEPRTLPGMALDADPRFPFFKMSEEIERVSAGEGKRIDAYLQLKTCSSEELRGKILIDSPGFDADAQRSSVLRLTDHIVNLSDLVLVFFDARHPEAGAMRDTLQHLVGTSTSRADSNKFLYILNQLDTTAREDNPEEVVAAWQRALAEAGLTAGRFYTIYNPDVAIPIEDPEQRRRFETKRDADLAEIKDRMLQVEVSRAYRIVGTLEKSVLKIRDEAMPTLTDALDRWRRLTLIFDLCLFGVLAVIAGVAVYSFGFDSLKRSYLAFPENSFGMSRTVIEIIKGALIVLALWFLHSRLRRLALGAVRGRLQAQPMDGAVPFRYGEAFLKSTRFPRSIFNRRPTGWSSNTKDELTRILGASTQLVQKLNDAFATPSGTYQATTKPADPTPN